jgi:putative ABC transport system permease protein
MLAPMLRRLVRAADGEAMELQGIDALALPRTAAPGLQATENVSEAPASGAEAHRGASGNAAMGPGGFAFPPYELWAAPARLDQLGWRAGDQIALANGKFLPPLRPVADRGLGHRLLIDIGMLQELTGSAGQLTAILVFPVPAQRLGQLLAALPPGLEYAAADAAPDPEQLTRSFHLNLAAMGLLAFVVGTFLVYNALAFSYTDRRSLLRKLRLSGVTRGELARGLLLELAAFLSAGTVLGYALGSLVASALLPGVGRTLAQLYGVYIRYPDTLVPAGLWLPLTMSGIAAAVCVIFPLRRALQAPLLQRHTLAWERHRVARRDRGLLVAGVGFLLVAGLLAWLSDHLWLALGGMASLLLGAALCLPAVLRGLLAVIVRLVPPHRARLAWLVADSRWLLGPASLALMAMSLALVANSGLNTMIGSFREATGEWLDQRLAADLYLRGDVGPPDLQEWLEAEAPNLNIAERFRTAIEVESPDGAPVRIEVVSLQQGPRFRDSVGLIRAQDDAEQRFEAAAGVYVSERAWRLNGWSPGNRVQPCAATRELPVLGVYRDYGNPQSQWMVSQALFQQCWPALAPVGIALYGPESTDWNRVREDLSRKFSLDDTELIDRRELRAAGLAVFDRTFTVTRALNALTLLVAGIGIFCAISAIHHHRVAQQALLASLGVTRMERAAMLLLQWSLFGVLCMALVWPFGTALAGYLAAVVTPVAFGWSFALHPDWHHYPVLALLAIACLLLAVLLPAVRLLRTSASVLLREETL